MGNYVRKIDNTATYSMKRRLFFLFGFFAALLLIIIGRLLYLQVFIGDDLRSQAIKHQTRDIIINPKRGTIYDSQKRVLAMSATAYSLYATPSEIRVLKEEDIQAEAKKLAQILGMDEKKIYKIITKKSSYETVALKIDNNKANQIRLATLPDNKTKLAGLELLEDSKRCYPKSNFLSHVLGFTGHDGNGIQGVELVYDKYLAGVPGRLIEETDIHQKQIPEGDQQYIKPKDGNSLVLSIDQVIQSYAESAIEQALIDTNATRATAIVMNPKTGEVLALVNKPDFNLNNPFVPSDPKVKSQWKTMTLTQKGTYLQSMWRSFAISDTYEPGSPFKIITSSAALEEGVVNPNTPYYCGGTVKVQGRSIQCWRYYNPHGAETFATGLQNSCNVVFVETGLKVGIPKMDHYVRGFGFDSKTGIDLTGEGQGILFNPKTEKDINLATMAFGQGIQVTPIEMIDAVCAVANDGKLMKPHLLKEVINTSGKVIYKQEPQMTRQVISKKTANELSGLLEKVVSIGTGSKAKIEGYEIAGKTGTSEKQPRGSGKYVASFAGFAPANDPKVAILVLIDEPHSANHFGGVIAAPVFKQIMENTLSYMGIKKKPPFDKPQTELVTISDYRGKKSEDATKELKQKGLSYEVIKGSGDVVVDQTPLPDTRVYKNTTVRLILKNANPSAKVDVPDLTGKTPEEVNLIVTKLGLIFNGIGEEGTVYSQTPAPGSKVLPGSEILIRFKTTDTLNPDNFGD